MFSVVRYFTFFFTSHMCLEITANQFRQPPIGNRIWYSMRNTYCSSPHIQNTPHIYPVYTGRCPAAPNVCAIRAHTSTYIVVLRQLGSGMQIAVGCHPQLPYEENAPGGRTVKGADRDVKPLHRRDYPQRCKPIEAVILQRPLNYYSVS